MEDSNTPILRLTPFLAEEQMWGEHLTFRAPADWNSLPKRCGFSSCPRVLPVLTLHVCIPSPPPHPPPYSDSQQKDEVCHLTEEELFSDTGAFYFQKNRLLLQDSFISKTVFVSGLPGQDPFPGDCAAPSFWWQTLRCLDPAGSSEDPGGTLTVPGPLLPTPPLWSIASLWRTLHTHT